MERSSGFGADNGDGVHSHPGDETGSRPAFPRYRGRPLGLRFALSYRLDHRHSGAIEETPRRSRRRDQAVLASMSAVSSSPRTIMSRTS